MLCVLIFSFVDVSSLLENIYRYYNFDGCLLGFDVWRFNVILCVCC